MDSVLKDKLLAAARAAMENAYAPYSGYRVGAAVLGKNGIYSGCNVENSSYGATICAERNALCHGVACGEREFSAVAVVSSGDTPYPCGICLQVMCELARDAEVVLESGDGRVELTRVEELIPKGFRL
ncbi:MAG: cytidine deaminase [Clostridia bacterium]|nr:cytidine deaminase [Clostridia bacterium]